ncbi:MAG: HEAT repeat domain-containing protein [Chitinophagaceae bacterium]|jgi:HEAT repeat protein
MAYYDLSKEERNGVVLEMSGEIISELNSNKHKKINNYLNNPDTYIRKNAYLIIGKIFIENTDLQYTIIALLEVLLKEESHYIRQTVINAAGEIGKRNFEIVMDFFDIGLFDKHHSPRNAVIGSIKKMGEVNPKPVLEWAKKYLHHPDKEIRREICHGIELRGRKYPEDILPLLKELEHDKTSRVRNTLIHVLGQIAYKKGCLATVITDLKTWKNKQLVAEAIGEIIDVHHRYRNFGALTQEEARDYINKNF